jgi:hypothetical protein
MSITNSLGIGFGLDLEIHRRSYSHTTEEDKAARLKQVLSNTERSAYAAAHRILTEQTHNPDRAFESARRISAVDRIAEIIMQEFGESSTMARTRTKRAPETIDTVPSPD